MQGPLGPTATWLTDETEYMTAKLNSGEQINKSAIQHLLAADDECLKAIAVRHDRVIDGYERQVLQSTLAIARSNLADRMQKTAVAK